MDRRSFIKNTVVAGAAFSALSLPTISVAGKTRPYRAALVGTGWWGKNILREAMAAGGIQVVALCDVDQNQLQSAATEVEKLTRDKPKRYSDYRELLKKEKPEIVIVATPDHWHPLITIAAVEQGAHVYVEKPIGHTINEGKAMVKAARDTNRVVQVGTHRRVSPHNVSGMEFLKSGKAGKIGMVRAFVHYGYANGPGEKTPTSEAPPGLNWDMWCGPAPLRPYQKDIHPRGFRNYLDYANGMLGDWGIHWFDQILWWTEEKGPRKIFSTGGKAIRQDSMDAPDHQVANFEFEDFTVAWEHRMFAGNEAEKGENVGCYFYGTEGTFHMGWGKGWTFYPVNKNKTIIHQEAQLHQPDSQNIKELWADFISSIKANKRPVCDIETGHRSTNMALLGMLSLKLGRSVAWDASKEIILNDPDANKLLGRAYRGEWQYPTV